jgi:hypothetical protein
MIRQNKRIKKNEQKRGHISEGKRQREGKRNDRRENRT